MTTGENIKQIKYLVFKYRKINFYFWFKPIGTCNNHQTTTEKEPKILLKFLTIFQHLKMNFHF